VIVFFSYSIGIVLPRYLKGDVPREGNNKRDKERNTKSYNTKGSSKTHKETKTI